VSGRWIRPGLRYHQQGPGHNIRWDRSVLAAWPLNKEKDNIVLGLLQDGACTQFLENLSENTLIGDLSNVTTFNPPLFSLVDTFKLGTTYKSYSDLAGRSLSKCTLFVFLNIIFSAQIFLIQE
jgi:hypothetical protein